MAEFQLSYTAQEIDEKLGKIDDLVANGGGSSTPADWNASEGEAGYVLNRTHYDSIGKLFVLNERTFEFFYDGIYVHEGLWEENFDLKTLMSVNVTFDGVLYQDVRCDSGNNGDVFFGNYLIAGGPAEGTEYPFFIQLAPMGSDPDTILILTTEPGQHTVSVYTVGSVPHTLDPKYIKDMYYDHSELSCEFTISDINRSNGSATVSDEFANYCRKHCEVGGDVHYPSRVEILINGYAKIVYNNSVYGPGYSFYAYINNDGTCSLRVGHGTRLYGLGYIYNNSGLIFVDKRTDGTGYMRWDSSYDNELYNLTGIYTNEINSMRIKLYDGDAKAIPDQYIPGNIARLVDVETAISNAVGYLESLIASANEGNS